MPFVVSQVWDGYHPGDVDWWPDEGDEEERRAYYNFIDNGIEDYNGEQVNGDIKERWRDDRRRQDRDGHSYGNISYTPIGERNFRPVEVRTWYTLVLKVGDTTLCADDDSDIHVMAAFVRALTTTKYPKKVRTPFYKRFKRSWAERFVVPIQGTLSNGTPFEFSYPGIDQSYRMGSTHIRSMWDQSIVRYGRIFKSPKEHFVVLLHKRPQFRVLHKGTSLEGYERPVPGRFQGRKKRSRRNARMRAVKEG
ncbi:MAG: hypothetical protein CMK92_02655 [Pseudomonas sp.]|nr:hypothetical protein [Pseudomonas sp.]